VRFRQSTFYSSPLSARFLRSHAAGFTPELSPEGASGSVPNAIDERSPTLKRIAESAASRFRQIFASVSAAIDPAAMPAEKLAR